LLDTSYRSPYSHLLACVMAEAIGLAASDATLASLFMGCVKAFELIHIVKTQDIELEKLNLKLNIESVGY
jgi:hypothetical protein